MINADDHDKTAEGSHALLSQLWLLPLLLLQAIFEVFSSHAQKLKQSRKETDPQVPDWPTHVEDLRTAEWMARWLVARNALKLMAGETIDLTDCMAPLPPGDWRSSEPRSVKALLARFEILTRCHADLMAAVLRHVRRLERQAEALAHPNAQPSSASPGACAGAQAAPAAPAVPAGWMLGIPRRLSSALSGLRHAQLNPQTLPARTRPHARNSADPHALLEEHVIRSGFVR
jgi:hypothetical protein